VSRQSLARVLTSRGNNGEVKRLYDAAMANLRESLAKCERLSDAEGECSALGLIGNELRAHGDLLSAKDSHCRAIELSKRFGERNPWLRIGCESNLGEVLLDLRDWQAVETMNRQLLQFEDGRIDKNELVELTRMNLLSSLSDLTLRGCLSCREKARRQNRRT
jgi:hypothetical protein